jgi:hypothetical protein
MCGMRTHELARRMLDMPDLNIGIWAYRKGYDGSGFTKDVHIEDAEVRDDVLVLGANYSGGVPIMFRKRVEG